MGLALTRKLDEIIEITAPDGSKIRITLIELGTIRAKLLIDAPRNFQINRLDRDGNLQTKQREE